MHFICITHQNQLSVLESCWSACSVWLIVTTQRVWFISSLLTTPLCDLNHKTDFWKVCPRHEILVEFLQVCLFLYLLRNDLNNWPPDSNPWQYNSRKFLCTLVYVVYLGRKRDIFPRSGCQMDKWHDYSGCVSPFLQS